MIELLFGVLFGLAIGFPLGLWYADKRWLNEHADEVVAMMALAKSRLKQGRAVKSKLRVVK